VVAQYRLGRSIIGRSGSSLADSICQRVFALTLTFELAQARMDAHLLSPTDLIDFIICSIARSLISWSESSVVFTSTEAM